MGGVILAFVITMVAIILVTYLDLVKGYGMSSLEKGGLFPVWLLFFVMGVYLGNRKERAYRLWPWLFVMGIVCSSRFWNQMVVSFVPYGIWHKGLRASLFVGGNHGIVFREDSAEVYLLWPLV